MAINLDYDSALRICGETKQIMVYGFQHCRYTQVSEALKHADSPFEKLFDCSIGGPFAPSHVLTTLEGRKLEQIDIPNLEQDDVVRELKQYCKAGLTNIVIENIKRANQGLPLIPTLFVIDIDSNSHSLNPKTLSSKEHTFVTFGELRRAYKLCEDPALHPEVRAIARATFKFVKTREHETLDGETFFSIEQIPPFWMLEGWNEAWSLRKEISAKTPISVQEKDKRSFWRDQLNLTLKREENQRLQRLPKRTSFCSKLTKVVKVATASALGIAALALVYSNKGLVL